MTINVLEGYLIQNIFAVLLIFSRFGAAIMLLPGFGESYVYPRARILIALAISLVMAPLLEPHLPSVPASPGSLVVLLISEILIGLMLGLLARMLLAIMHVTGMIISYQSSLALATQFDSSQVTQGSIIGNFFSLFALMLIFAFDLHHMLLRGVADSYSILLPTNTPPLEDMASYMVDTVALVFRIGIQLAAPSIVSGLLIYLAAGALSRIMPNMQVFFVIMPLQLYISFFILMITTVGILTEWVEVFSTTYSEWMEGL
ncbi:MAG: flagellar biosynthetic protein FliR [Alphaproteobacteria bacterium]|nr:MAG: flagellar biosynthetic protein FliR [Alphaproteobacteria bacterium]